MTFAHAQDGAVKGTVLNSEGQPAYGVVVRVPEQGIGAMADEEGTFFLTGLERKVHTLQFEGFTYRKREIQIDLSLSRDTTLQIVLENESYDLSEVVVSGKHVATQLEESGFSVYLVNTESARNLNTDINQVLKQTPGIHIRETGGLGSGFKVSLNGLSGNQLRYFLDGVPMENFGSALTLNNFPVNLVESVEVYKGVVPVNLGADALGGAINIRTVNKMANFLDAAYAFGSFNTHRLSLNGRYTHASKGFYLNGLAYFNHSDNDYRMKSVPVYDLELGNKIGDLSVRRFHDRYRSGMFTLTAGLHNRKFADIWSASISNAANHKQYQHPDNNILRVFGGFAAKNHSLLSSTNYEKQFGPVVLRTYAVAGRVVQTVADTSSRKYNWAGDYIDRPVDDPKGELALRRSLFEMKDIIAKGRVGLGYRPQSGHHIEFNGVHDFLWRRGQDLVDEFNYSFRSPNQLHKTILALAYTFSNRNESLELTAFAKQYVYGGKISATDAAGNESTSRLAFANTGYGVAVAYKVNGAFLVKASWEKTYRLPEAHEILGDGIYVDPNQDLLPESSHNVNAGFRLYRRWDTWSLQSEANAYYRRSQDFIRFNPLGPFGQYENLRSVSTLGMEASLGVGFREWVSFDFSLTFQSLTDRNELDEGLPNINYKSRIPNVPSLFGQVQVGVFPLQNFPEHQFGLRWGLRFVDEYFLIWENLGNPGGKHTIPAQLVQDASVEYGFHDGTYNISLAVENLFDQTIFDNYNIQKPGRSFSVKVRYFFQPKSKKQNT